MTRPTADQIAAAAAILKQHSANYAGTASDTMLANTVYSILAVCGGAGQPSQEFSAAIANATNGLIKVKPMLTDNGDGTFTVAAENPLGLPVGETFINVAEFEGDDEEPEEPEEEDDGTEPAENEPQMVPSPEALDDMTKDQLFEQAAKEKVEVVTSANKADIKKAILDGRKKD